MMGLYRRAPTRIMTGAESLAVTKSENTGCETTGSESVEDDESKDDNISVESLDLQDTSYAMREIYYQRLAEQYIL